MQAEANRVSLALTGVKQDLEREGRTCKSRSCAGSLKPQLVASQEYNNVAEERAAMQCHNKISRKKQAVAKRTAEKKKQAMAKRTADKDRQWPSDRTAEKTLEILVSQAHTHHVVVLSSCHIALL